MKGLRAQLSDNDAAALSDIIADKVIQTKAYKECDVILPYVDFNREVITRKLIEDAWEKGKTVAVPRIKDKHMEFYVIKSFDELKPGYYGIYEPYECDNPAYYNKVLMIMPGLAFDMNFNRIGYGAGFYDSYISAHRDMELIKLALAYDFQITEDIIDAEEFDIKADIIITEKRTLFRH